MPIKNRTFVRVSIILILTGILSQIVTIEEPIQAEPVVAQTEATSTLITPEPLPELVPVVPILAKIAWCESRNVQLNPDGSVLRGKINSQDVGKWQINESYHLAESKRLGLDLHTEEGNEEYAVHLFLTQGTRPWNWSKPCWGDEERVWTKKNGEYWSK